MEEQEAVSEEQEQEQQGSEQVAAYKGGPKYPKTMTRGRFAGKTFQSYAEHKAAMDEAHKNGLPKRRYRKAQAKPVKQSGSYRLQVDLDGQTIVAEVRSRRRS